MNGITFIHTERRRQQLVEGWTLEHDDEHWRGELKAAAEVYERAGDFQVSATTGGLAHAMASTKFIASSWPWDVIWFKPGKHAFRTYVKAGALYQAEIERLVRAHPFDVSPARLQESESLTRARNRVARKLDDLLS